MTHHVHPYIHRIGTIRTWKSRWFGDKESYQDLLKADVIIRKFIEKELRTMYVGSVELERSKKFLRIIIKTSRPGLVIGRSGDGISVLKKKIDNLIKKRILSTPDDIRFDIQEIKSPESHASIVSQMVREGLEKRLPFRRVLKQTLEKVLVNRDVKGVRISISGRLNGAEMARREEVKNGRIPLQTFRADVDYAHAEAVMAYGVIGIKVWIYRGDIFGNPETTTKQTKTK